MPESRVPFLQLGTDGTAPVGHQGGPHLADGLGFQETKFTLALAIVLYRSQQVWSLTQFYSVYTVNIGFCDYG